MWGAGLAASRSRFLEVARSPTYEDDIKAVVLCFVCLSPSCPLPPVPGRSPVLGRTKPVQWVLGVQHPGSEADHLSGSLGGKNVCTYTCTPPHDFMSWALSTLCVCNYEFAYSFRVKRKAVCEKKKWKKLMIRGKVTSPWWQERHSALGGCRTVGAEVRHRLDAWVVCILTQEWAFWVGVSGVSSVLPSVFDSIHCRTLPNATVNLIGPLLSD